MLLTSASANKMIKFLEDQKNYLLSCETNERTYVLAVDEAKDIPDYDFNETNNKIDKIDFKIRTLKHALNSFNSTTLLSIGITIDEALVEMAQLNKKLPRLDRMRKATAKTRVMGYNSSRRDIAEYEYLNYNIKDVDKVYEDNMRRVQDIQLALDLVNQTVEFEVDINY